MKVDPSQSPLKKEKREQNGGCLPSRSWLFRLSWEVRALFPRRHMARRLKGLSMECPNRFWHGLKGVSMDSPALGDASALILELKMELELKVERHLIWIP